MKKKYVFSLALATAMLSACSSDDLTTNPPGTTPEEAGDAYISLALNLPTQKSIRANGNFDDGDASEYAVKDGIQAIFTGTDEASATVFDARNLDVTPFNPGNNTSNDQITTTAKIVQLIKNPAAQTGLKYYALVLLNAASQGITVDNLTAGVTTPGTEGGEATTSSKKLTDIANLKTAFGVADGLFMSNSPVVDKAGGTSDPSNGATLTTLSPIDPAKIYDTKEEAEKNPASSIYVERAAAKIQVSGSNGSLTGTPEGTTVAYTLGTWYVDNYNTTSYPVRKFDTGWLGYTSSVLASGQSSYRFAGAAPIETGVYRTYWGTDVNYEGSDGLVALTGSSIANATLKADIGGSVYVHENTFDVAHQSKNNTTRVVLTATFNNGQSFITDNQDDTDVIYGSDAWNAKAIQDATTPSAAAAKIKAWADEWLVAGTYTDIYKVSWTDADANSVVVPTITIDTDKLTADKVQEGKTLAAAVAAFDALGLNANSHTYTLYPGGKAYYSTLIRHFDDSESPWTGDLDEENTIGGVYGTNVAAAEANYLGRWGLLRNNWYQLTVTGISHIGSPVIPSITTDPDDEIDTDQYIRVSINILPWAVRTQNVGL